MLLSVNIGGISLTTKLAKETFDFINRQKAENERLRNALVGECMLSACQRENEIKIEAYNEFAERLKCGVPQETGVIRCKDVDFTLTELTERKDDEGK